MNYLEKTNIPESERGQFRIERFTVSDEEAKFDALRGCIGGGGFGRSVPAGGYTRLMRGGTLVMSDTPDELRDHRWAVSQAKGDCLIHGLGLGIVAEACLRKPEVTSVTVIEISSDVIDLVKPYLMDKWSEKLAIVQGDALSWKPHKGAKFGMVWHDIWDDICSDNLDEIKKLHRRYGRRTDWQGSWARELCERYAY